MPISYSETVQFTCPACHRTFTSEVWLIIDAQEQPEQTAALHQQTLTNVTCPHCGHAAPAGFPLLFHDSVHRCVIFAAPPATEEYIWREQARELHALLVGSIPIEQRHPYLADVQIAHDRAGVKHLLDKIPRRAPQQARTTTPDPQPLRAPPRSQQQPPDADALMSAIEALTHADTLEEVQRTVDTHAVLRRPDTDIMLEQLADVAFEQGEYASAEILREVRRLLQSLVGSSTPVAETDPETPPTDLVRLSEPGSTAPQAPAAGDQAVVRIAAPADTKTLPPQDSTTATASIVDSSEPSEPPGTPAYHEHDLSDDAYLALLDVHTSAQLVDVVRTYPVLLEAWVDDLLALRSDQVLSDGHEDLAHDLEQRRELLAELRQNVATHGEWWLTDTPATPPGTATTAPPDPHLLEAVQTLLTAEDEETIGQVLFNYPILLTDSARQLLWDLASEARKRGDDDLAIYAIECRAMLQEVSEGLQEE